MTEAFPGKQRTGVTSVLAGLAFTALSVVVAAGAACLPLASYAQQAGNGEGHLLNYRDADIQAVVDDMAMLTERTFIVSPRVTGKITIVSETEIPTEAIFDVFMAALSVSGFTATQTGTGAYKIVPIDRAAVSGGSTMDAPTGESFITRAFRLRHVDALAALNLVRPLINENGRAIAARGSDTLILVDTAANIERIARVIADFDTDRRETKVIPLTNLSAREMADIVAELSRETGGDDSRAVPAVSAVPVASGNVLILRGMPERLAELEPIIRDIDSVERERGDLQVIYLRHATAENLAPLLREVASRVDTQAVEAGQATPDADTTISFDKATNALVINANPSTQAALREVIEKLDIRREQVLVEAIIVEISDDVSRALGLQYVLSGDGENSQIPFTATNFSASAPGILNLTGAVVGTAVNDDDEEPLISDDAIDGLQSAAISAITGTTGFLGGIVGQGDDGTIFGLIVNALEQDTGSNVLSTPSILTLDNETARIQVGQNVPVTSGEALGTDFQNPFRTVDRRDIGIILEVVPQITEGDTVTLSINQEVSSIFGDAFTTSDELIFNTRQLTSTVSADDGDIIVLGGLIDTNEVVSIDQVPLLGDIPVLGRLFRNETRTEERTNLMVFLRPVIVRDAQDLENETARRYNYMRAEQLLRSNQDLPRIDGLVEELMGAEPPRLDEDDGRNGQGAQP